MTWGKAFNFGKCENFLWGKMYMLSEIASTPTVSKEGGMETKFLSRGLRGRTGLELLLWSR